MGRGADQHQRPTSPWVREHEALRDHAAQRRADDVDGVATDGVVVQTVETEAKYCGYIDQQRRQIERLRRSDDRAIPAGFAYADIPGLSREVQAKLERVRPGSLGQAARIPGVTPAAIAVLDIYLSASHVC